MRTFLIKLRAAIDGIAFLIRSERHFNYHLVATVAVSVLGILSELSQTEWLVVLSAIFSVLTAEAFNTAIEKVCDEITLDRKTTIKRIKDVSAGAVLMTVIYSVIVGLIIFLPKFLVLVGV